MALLLAMIGLSISSIALVVFYMIHRRDGGFHRMTYLQLAILGGFALVSMACLVGAFVAIK
jgi:hypothetical protein